MKTYMKVAIAIIGSGAIGGLTFGASIFPEWGQILSFVTLAISGTMAKLIGWPPKTPEV